MTCTRCNREAIALYADVDERGVCMACLFGAVEFAERAQWAAQMRRIGVTSVSDLVAHAAHRVPVDACGLCE